MTQGVLSYGSASPLLADRTLNGNGNTLSGNNAYRGLFVYSGTVAINDLTIENAVASGGDAGQAAGGGAGLGGALFVKDGATVTISNLVAQNNAATGGDGGAQITGGITGGDGGGWRRLSLATPAAAAALAAGQPVDQMVAMAVTGSPRAKVPVGMAPI